MMEKVMGLNPIWQAAIIKLFVKPVVDGHLFWIIEELKQLKERGGFSYTVPKIQ